jgi:spoIIIJ-associated protein
MKRKKMTRVEAITLEAAYIDAASTLKCSITELQIEVVQQPSSGFLGFFKKNAIIIVAKKELEQSTQQIKPKIKESTKTPLKEEKTSQKEFKKTEKKVKKEKLKKEKPKKVEKKVEHTILNDTIMPASFVSDQDDDDLGDALDYTADYDDAFDNEDEESILISDIAVNIEEEINTLFDLTCFSIDKIEVSVYDENTLLVEFKGEDAALLIGKEGYRYKALSYMIFNWINTKYQIQLRLEIAEFLKNQEESVSRYLVGVCENIERDGRAQTKILDGVLVQIALHELREKYPQKYVVIRSTRDGLKYIIVNDYHNNN